MRTAEQIILAARECLGAPFRHQGRVPALGIDCAGLARHAVMGCGASVVDVVGYGPTPNKGTLQSVLDAQPDLYVVGDRQPGDILLMKFAPDGPPQHLAVFTGETIIHAYEKAGGCREHRMCSMWDARVVRVYRVKGLA